MAVGDPQLLGWLADSLSSGLIAIDRCGRVLLANPAARRILGLGAADGGPAADFRELLRAHPPLLALLEAALEGRERPGRSELMLPGAGGAERAIEFSATAIRDAAGAPRGAAILFRDLAPFEQADEQARLRERLAALGEMAAGLVHELRNPLASMQVLADLIGRRSAPGGEQAQLVAGLLGQLRGMEAVLGETLAFVRPAPPAPRELDPVALFESCLDRACARVPFPGKIERSYSAPLPALRADREQLQSALTDILVNALEAMAECEGGSERRLSLRLEAVSRPRPELVFSVSDTGPGVPAVLRERIFHPFFSTKDGGGGVGLAKAQKVVGGHGGAIELDSREGHGATFRVRLPAGLAAR
jgi:PAS domain S-box-containing protein